MSTIEDREDASEFESCVVWFQASPLAFENGSEDGNYLSPLDIQQEQNVIQRVFDEAPKQKRRRAQVNFEVGTTRQLGSFLQLARTQPKQCMSLHISCHARPRYLAFEDGWGTALPITVTYLEKLMQSHRSDGEGFASVFQLIFIAACKSRSIGEALRNAGAAPIVCAHSDRTDINVSYVLEFSKVMYSTLLSSESVSANEAYDRAMHEVSMYPAYRDLPPQLWLLSDKDSQDCAACRGSHGRLPIQSKRRTSTCFPKPPSYFSRHDTEVWKVLQLVKDTQDENARISWVTGEDELGTARCTTQSACQCLEQRFETNSIEGIVWMELRAHPSLCNGSYQVTLTEVTDRIKTYVQDRNMILVLDATLLEYESVPLLVDKISTLIETTEHVKFISINSEPIHVNCEDRHISIPVLGLKATVKIFGRLYRHVTEERAPGTKCSASLWYEMVRRMELKEDGDSSLLSYPRYCVLYKGFGKGKLDNMVHSVRTISQEEFSQYASLGCCRSLDALHSRYLLLKYCHKLQSSIYDALDKNRHEEVRGLQKRLDMMPFVLHEFIPSMTELWAKFDSVSKGLRAYCSQPRCAKRSIVEFSRLKEEERNIKRQIEKAASFRVKLNYTVADLDICAKKERELELIVDFTNDLLLQYYMHQGDYEKEVLLSSLENGSGTIASLQMSVEEGLEQSRATLFSSLECLPLSPDQVGCDQYLQTFRAAKRSKSAIKIQALTRGMLTRNEVEPVKNAFLLNVQKLILQKMSCCRRFVRDEDEQTVDEDEDEDDDMIAPAA